MGLMSDAESFGKDFNKSGSNIEQEVMGGRRSRTKPKARAKTTKTKKGRKSTKRTKRAGSSPFGGDLDFG